MEVADLFSKVSSLALKQGPAVWISLAAFVLALISMVLTLRQKAAEATRTLRAQLTDTIDKLVALEVQISDLDCQIADRAATQTYDQPLRALRNIHGEQRLSLAQLAVFLMDQPPMKRPGLIGDVEYAALARALAASNDLDQARHYWEKAFEVSTRAVYRTKLIGLYADFLWNKIDREQARQRYEEALGHDAEHGDSLKWEKLHISSRWAEREAKEGDSDKAKTLFRRADDICRSLDSKALRQEGETQILEPRRKEIVKRAG